MKLKIYLHQKKIKMVIKSKTLLLLAIFMASVSFFAQSSKEIKANKQFEKLNYVGAIKTYEELAAKGYKSKEMLQQLADSYYFKADLDNAAKWYGELFAYTKRIPTEYYYRYSQSLKAIKDYKKADEMLVIFNEKNNQDLRAKLANSQKNYPSQIKKNSGRYTFQITSINSKYSDYGAAFFGNKLIFASARDTSVLAKRTHTWKGESFTNLYEADIDQEGALSNPKRFDKKLNSKFHESTPVFTKDGKTVYFTRNNFLDGKIGKDLKRIILLKLYKATLEEDKWTKITELPFNSDQYSVAHPALSADEKTLYFASDMPGTIGQSDLFKVSINADGGFGTPTNLGNEINTEGRETFPMMNSDGELYFASDGHPGLGGLDVFVAKASADGKYKNVQNVGEPINSPKDDFGFLINFDTKYGYVTSNREGGTGGDDIYRFKENKKLECEHFLDGIVTDKITGLPIAYAKVTLSDANNKMMKEVMADQQGKFDFGQVVCDATFNIKAEKMDYITVETTVITSSELPKTFVKIDLEKPLKPFVATKVFNQGDDLFKVLGLKMIYFDLDKSIIRKDAAIELAKVLAVLKENPSMELDIRSHTDCRSKASYNLALSDRRAKSTMAWLVKNGIAKTRLKAKGYGESQLLNNCDCEPPKKSTCSEEEHQANRRSEFIVTKN